MNVTIRYDKNTQKLFVLLSQEAKTGLIRGVNYYAFRALVNMHYEELSKMDGVLETLDTEENLSHEYYHCLEAQMPIMAAWFKLDNEQNASKIYNKVSELLKMHCDNIRRLSTKSGELTQKTNDAEINLMFEVV